MIYESPTLVRYFQSTTVDLYPAILADGHFDETYFPSLGGDMECSHSGFNARNWRGVALCLIKIPHYLKWTNVQRIIDLQKVKDSMLNDFTDIAKVTRSHINAVMCR